MKRLERIFLIQFYLFDAEEVEVSGNTAWLGPNGAGKTSVLDAIQIALLGAHQGYLKFNTQSVSTSQKKNHRSIRDYCLGTIMDHDNKVVAANDEERKIALIHRRDVADTYITLVFRDDVTGEPVSLGVALHAQLDSSDHTLKGLYVLPGVELELNDHTETVKDETVPLRWKDFEYAIRNKCMAVGRTPEITDKTESYIREMLHALQPRAKHINHRDFMKAFRKSVTLRDIESVNDFVRDFLVEAHPIDKHRAIAQIEDFRRLDNLVKQTKEQINTLGELSKRYDKLAAEHRESATMDYLVAHYEHEDLSLRVGTLEDAIETEQSLAKKADTEMQRLEKVVEEIGEQISRDEQELNSNPASRQASDFHNLLEDAKKALTPHLRSVGSQRLALATAFERLNAVPGFTQSRPECAGMAVRLGELAKQVDPDTEKARKVLVDALGMVNTHRPWVERVLPEAREAQETADTQLKGLLSTYKAIDKHGVRLSPNTASAIDLLAENGIQATPVCSLVRVTQLDWQPAIEAYLGSNRESLVITGGRERDAIRVMRELPESRRLYNVTIIQPAHLSRTEWADSDNVLVGSLITGDNAAAMSYLRMLLGKTRRVETEEELERYPQSLTVDGMLSKSGGTRPIKLVRPADFMIGTKINDAEKNVIQRQIADASTEYSTAKQYFDALDNARKAIEQLGNTERMAETIAEVCDELKRLNSQISRIGDQVASLQEDGSITFLRDSIQSNKAELDKQNVILKKAIADAATHKANAVGKQKDLDALQPVFEVARGQVEVASNHEDFDSSIVQRVQIEHDSRTDFPTHLRKADCSERRVKAQARIQNLTQKIAPEFDRYLTSANITLIDERQGWRKARQWVSDEHERLEDSQLAQYQEEVDNAKMMAEKAFREDVAVRISEAIQRTQNSLAELNKILDSCPPFSNGEKYAFEATPAEAYKSLYKYIVDASRGADFFTGDNSASEELISYLQKSIDPEEQKSGNPLDDYRLLFNFDLRISQGGKLVGRLSQRVGPGSNGEHRTPFYVIAGAALASAYRIRSGETNTGAALMIIDEAFHGMDSQNSLAAARFLKSLGLQILIAAPDSELGKLTPICDTVYELMRFGQDVFMEATYIKEAAHTLMISDMPAEHPQMILDKMAEIEAQT
jgi:chromosome segregation protein